MKLPKFQVIVLVSIIVAACSLNNENNKKSLLSSTKGTNSPAVNIQATSTIHSCPYYQEMIIPQRTTREGIHSLLGTPAEELPPWGSENIYDENGRLKHIVYYYEQDSQLFVHSIFTHPENLNLQEVVSLCGPPLVIELTFLGRAEPPLRPQKIYHYPELGLSYFTDCAYPYRCSANSEREERVFQLAQGAPTTIEKIREELPYDDIPLVEWMGFGD